MASETIEDVQARHRKESKELQAKIMGLKKSVPKGDKKKKKQVTEEIAELEEEQKKRHANEITAASAGESSGPAEGTAAATEDENSSVNDLAKGVSEVSLDEEPKSIYNTTDKKPSKQQLRREKKKQEFERERALAEEEASKMTNHKKIEEDSINEQLKPLNLKVKEINADGHCLYNSIADQLEYTGHQKFKSYSELRKVAADYMRKNSDDFIPFIYDSGDKFDVYCDKVESTATWGGQPEIVAISKALEVPIFVVQANIPILKIGEDYSNKPLYISYHRHSYGLGEHYNSLHSTI